MSENQVEKWVLSAVYINRKTGERKLVSSRFTGSLADAKRHAKQSFKPTRSSRIISVVVKKL